MADVVGKRISELANNASIDGTAIFPHTQNGSTMRVSLSNITDYILAQVDEDTVKDAVNEWMTYHPDVTTTVQDGAISTVKLANDAVTSEKIKNGTIAGIDLSIDLLNAICASGSASGSVATFPDGAYGLPLKSCIVSVNPVQSGSGDPSPTNIRPITGWDGANVSRTGKNLWDEEWESGAIKLSDGQKQNNSNTIRSKNYIPVKAGQSYFVKNGSLSSQSAMVFFWYKADYTYINFSYCANTAITAPDNAVWGLFYNSSTYGTTYNNDISINYPSTDHDYHEGHVQTVMVDWQSEAGIVYGGALDVTNGILTVTMAMVDLGALTWTLNSNRAWGTLPNAKVPLASELPNAIAEQYVAIKANQTVTNGKFAILNRATGNVIFFYDGENTPSGQLVYELATPITYQLTPTEVRTLLGTNNVWADCGDISVEYFADTQTYIEQRINATKSIITGVEAGFVATKNYSIGDLLIVEDTLYITTTAIASGAALTPGTNISTTTVADQLGGSLSSAQGG